MTKELEKIEELTEIVREQYEQSKQLLIIARDSMNDKGYSDAIYQLQKEIKEMNKQMENLGKQHEERDAEMKQSMAPIVKAFNNVDGTANTIKFIAKLGTSIGIVLALVVGLKEFFKN